MTKKPSRRAKQTTAAISSSPASSSSSVTDAGQLLAEKRIRDLELENKAFQKEIEEPKNKLANTPLTSDDSAQKLKENPLKKLIVLEEQVTDLKKKLDVRSQPSVQRQKSDEAAKRSQDEILRLKAQKVQLQCKMKLESMQFRLCKASLEKEVLQLKKEGRRKEYEMHKQLALNQRQRMVLQRKTEEASMATNRLKELIESRKALSSRAAGARNGNIPRIQGIERELEVTVRISEVCSEYEQQMEEMAEEVAKLKEEAEILRQENYRYVLQEKEVDSREDLELKDLKEQVLRLSGLVTQMGTRKAELGHGEKSQVDLSQPSVSAGSSIKLSGMGTSESEHSEGVAAAIGKFASRPCCSCSKKSSCKTLKCECRAARGSCGKSCGCTPSKCANREAVLIKLDEPPQSEMAEDIGNSGIVETERSSILASQGAMLLQSAMVQKPAARNDRGPRKKPLRDIGNTLMKSDAIKPSQSKKGKNSAIQVVPAAPPPWQPEDSEALKRPQKSVLQADIPLKLPRATRSAALSMNTSRERNSDQPDEIICSKATGVPAPRSPVPQADKSIM